VAVGVALIQSVSAGKYRAKASTASTGSTSRATSSSRRRERTSCVLS
jgi:hypothetical protein